MRYLIAVLALAGVVVSSLALHVHYSTEVQPCSINEKWDCGIVNHSPFAEIEHIPVAIIGIVGYSLIGLVALWGYTFASKPMALLLVVLTWLVVGLAIVAVKCRAA